MKLAHNSGYISRAIGGLVITLTFFGSLLRTQYHPWLPVNELSVLGGKAKSEIDTGELLLSAANDVSKEKYKLAEEKLSTVLTFDPDNVYAREILSRVNSHFGEIEEQITKTLAVLKNQPDWQAAWIKLADLYEKVGEDELSTEAKEKAKRLKTS